MGTALELRPRPVAGSIDELLAGATKRTPFLTSDSKSGCEFERVEIDGAPHILKHVHIDGDWTMRFLRVPDACFPLTVWASGLMDVLPERVEHGVVGVAGGLGRDGVGAAVLMRDLADALVPPGDDPLSIDDHLTFIDDMAGLAAATWGWEDAVGLVPLERRWQWFSDENLDADRAAGWPNPVPEIAARGWQELERCAPRALVDALHALRTDASPLHDALTTTPFGLLHGDWKLGNVGRAADGRTVLIDWTYPGVGPVCHDLGWYLALNRSRLPISKEDTIAACRTSLERHGIDTAPWWDRQLGLCLLGSLVQFGWEKALGDPDELGWWCERAEEGLRLL